MTFVACGNSQEAKMSLARPRGFFLFESVAIVLDLQRHVLRAVIQFNRHLRCFGMLDDIRERFLRDAEQIFLDRFREAARGLWRRRGD